ncbi:MAG: DegT/DnrJ/EryC1/StrS family aminotransferase [Bacteroidales bacterium]|jgi:dTDP-4-amino-4,6-dideoxygalactose transaminase|nr:DegT/DnrJ/EryC1/StrS family aminotransferase [Bacteroidales bacterium]
MEIQMLDLKGQYIKIKEELDREIDSVLNEAQFIGGRQVYEFASALADYLSSSHVIPCANGTDALQIALMSLNLERGDEVILPAFTYAATAEVVALLGLTPVLVDVCEESFNIDTSQIPAVISEKTKAIMPVHLFGQSAEMSQIIEIASRYHLKVIEDNAQALGAKYQMPSGEEFSCGTIGDIGCTSFFPSKNLGCYGDGGAMFTQDDKLAERLRMIANHGQKVKYTHTVVGCNSRLDTIQAAILKIKLNYLDSYITARREAATLYNDLLYGVSEIVLPKEMAESTHVYHQYTILSKRRDELKEHLQKEGIPTMIYYPIPLQNQPAFKERVVIRCETPVALKLSQEVLSLPMHTELTYNQQMRIADSIKKFYKHK